MTFLELSLASEMIPWYKFDTLRDYEKIKIILPLYCVAEQHEIEIYHNKVPCRYSTQEELYICTDGARY